MATTKDKASEAATALGVEPATKSDAEKLDAYQKTAKDGGFGVVGGHFMPDLDMGPSKEAVKAPKIKARVGTGDEAHEILISGGTRTPVEK